MANLAIRGYRQSRRLNCLAVLGINSQTEPVFTLFVWCSATRTLRAALLLTLILLVCHIIGMGSNYSFTTPHRRDFNLEKTTV